MTVYAIVPVHNRVEFTEMFLISLRSQVCSHDIQIVVVDDGSTDGTATFLADQRDVIVLKGGGNLWWAGSIALALRSLATVITSRDYVYLGNNDTILDPGHIQALVNVSRNRAVVGSVSTEIWPDGTHNPVSSGFMIDTQTLDVRNAGLERGQGLDALAGRGMLVPSQTIPFLRLHPHLMPQHFADLGFTAHLRRMGVPLVVAFDATSTQLERAGSSVEFTPHLIDAFSKRSQIYLPAMWTFWWLVSTPTQRITLPARFAARGIRQWRRGAYA